MSPRTHCCVSLQQRACRTIKRGFRRAGPCPATAIVNTVNRLKRFGQDDRNLAIPIRVAGAIDVALAAGPEGGEDPVRAEAGAGLQGQ
jgi:hypothetical protein